MVIENKHSPCADVDINGFYPWVLKECVKNKEETVMVATYGEKGAGMTYHALRLADLKYKPKYTREGNLVIATLKMPKSG
jgi:hypothetical protein